MERRIALTAIPLQEKSCELRNGILLRNSQSCAMDLDWIRRGLEKPGKTQKGLAEALKLDPSQVTRILTKGRRLRADEIEKVRLYLDESIPGERQAPVPVVVPRDVPVEGTAAGGHDGGFIFEGGTIDYLRRPPRLMGIPSAYALYVLGDSMSPWRRNGEPVYVHPGQPPQIRDRVVARHPASL
jgi:phage repressor protein C with HTH and peptisase S24 domain